MFRKYQLFTLQAIQKIHKRYYAVKTKTKAAATPEVKQKTAEISSIFPEKFIKKKHKTPDHLYIAEAKAAKLINEALNPFFKETKCQTFLEVNPGIGAFTRELLNYEQFRKIILIENLAHFMQNLEEYHTLYPERVKVKQGDVIGAYKSAYLDKLDNGNRLQDLLADVPKANYEDDPCVIAFAPVGSYTFFRHLVNSMVFQSGLLNSGRWEMYLIVPPPIYIHLTCSNEIGYLIYRSTSILFQMFFEHRFITQLPREYFLPHQYEYNFNKHSKLSRVRSINPEYLYLVRIVPRHNLKSICNPIDWPALWYFVKQNCVSRSNRVIPNLEKVIPGCGPRLIINKTKRIPTKPLYPDEDPTNLPKYSTRCMTLSNQDFFPSLNIYTEFGDLSPSQILTLFTTFRQWPEYAESSFLASLENTLLKMESTEESNIDTLAGIAEEDDLATDDVAPAEEDFENTEQKTEKVVKKRRKKKDAAQTES